MRTSEREQITEAVGITCELTGTVLTPAALVAFVGDLLPFGVHAILPALARCRQEVRGRLTVADVLIRLEDGRPTADAAWAMIPDDEARTIVWTDEMALAYGAAAAIRRGADEVGARLAFGREYERLVRAARAAKRPVAWRPSLGYDATQRAEAMEQAVRLGRLPASQVAALLGVSGIAEETNVEQYRGEGQHDMTADGPEAREP